MTEQPTSFPTDRAKCPKCPMCGSTPAFIWPGLAQSFCENEDCNVLCWNPWEPASANLNDLHPAIVTMDPPE